MQAQGIAAMPPDRSAQLRKAATEFEAVAIGEMLAPMFETIDTAHGPFGGGEGEAAWQPMMTQAIGRQIAEHGGFGLADSIYRTLMRAQEAHSLQTAPSPQTQEITQ